MQRTQVVSSNLKSVGYDERNEVLEIEFKTGSVYQYFNVPKNLFERLMSAGSHGKYFVRNIKNAGFHYKRIG